MSKLKVEIWESELVSDTHNSPHFPTFPWKVTNIFSLLVPPTHHAPVHYLWCQKKVYMYFIIRLMRIACYSFQQLAGASVLPFKFQFLFDLRSEITRDRYEVWLMPTFKVKWPMLKSDSDLGATLLPNRATSAQHAIQSACRGCLTSTSLLKQTPTQMHTSCLRAPPSPPPPQQPPRYFIRL